MTTYSEASTKTVAATGIDYAFREVGEADVPLVLLQHFRGNLDNWDPALIDALASTARVVTFDNAGVGSSTARRRATSGRWRTMRSRFSTGWDASRSTSSASRSGASSRRRSHSSDRRPSASSCWRRLRRRARRACTTTDRDAPTSWETRLGQYNAVCAWGQPNHLLLERLHAIAQPVFIANGDSDPMILPNYSHLIAGLIPQARIKIYPDSAHDFLFQHHTEFAADVAAFVRGS